jgi:hypothetical protein
VLGIEGGDAGGLAHLRAHLEHAGEGALRDQERPLALGDHDAQPLAHEVVRDLVELPRRLEARPAALGREGDRLVERAREARLQARVEPRRAHHCVRGRAARIRRRVEVEDAPREGRGLVGAEHVHAAEVFDRVQTPHDHAVGRHVARPLGERHLDDRGQELRRDPDGEGEGEEQRLDRRALEEELRREDEQHEQHRDPHQQVAVLADSALELRLGGTQAEPGGDLPERRVLARAHHQRQGGPAADRGPHEHAVHAFREPRVPRDGRRALLDGKRLPRERRLADEQVSRLEHHPVRGNQAACRQHDDVAGDQLLRPQRRRLAVAQRRRADAHPGPQTLEGPRGAVLLEEA